MIISGLTMMAIAFAEVSILARAIAVGAEGISGAILAVWAMGSIAGGIAYGARHWPGTQSQQLAFIMTAAATMFLPLAAPGPLLVLVPAALIAGLALAPSAAINAAILGASPSPDTKTEAFGWLTAATGLGGALGYALAGPVVDLSGERITIVCGSAGGVCRATRPGPPASNRLTPHEDQRAAWTKGGNLPLRTSRARLCTWSVPAPMTCGYRPDAGRQAAIWP